MHKQHSEELLSSTVLIPDSALFATISARSLIPWLHVVSSSDLVPLPKKHRLIDSSISVIRKVSK